MTARKVIRRIKALGCKVERQRGSHAFVRCPGGCTTIVPIHKGDISTGTLRSIERDLEKCLGKGWLK